MPSSDQSAAPVRVLLVNLNRYDQPSPVYPLGLAYVDSALRAAGHATRIWDARMSPAPLEAAVAAFAPDYVGLSLRNIDNVQCHNPRSFIHELLECCRNLRACTRAPLVLGGSGFSVFPRELYELTGVDYGIAGDGERAFVRLRAPPRTTSPAWSFAIPREGCSTFPPRRTPRISPWIPSMIRRCSRPMSPKERCRACRRSGAVR